MIPLITAEEMRAAEHRFAAHGGDLQQLMDVAGTAVAERIARGRKALILAGPGNNGGDALVCARRLMEKGWNLAVFPYKRVLDNEFSAVTGSSDDTLLHALGLSLEGCDVVVDGLLGTGPRRPVEGLLADILALVNRAEIEQRVAIDLPTGVDADSGQVDTIAFRATLTVTLGIGKRGLWTYPGAEYAGAVDIVDLGLFSFAEDISCFLTTPEDVTSMLPRRSRDSNKGKNGRVLVVAGSRDFSGAPVLAATAAYRSGAGLVELAVPSHVQERIGGAVLEPIFAHLEHSSDHLSQDELTLVRERASKAQAFVLGPGLGAHADTVAFVRGFLDAQHEEAIPGVLDADGLNAIASWASWWDHAPHRLVVTPHPGEMARLMNASVPEVQANRFDAAQSSARRWGVVVVLKGANTIIANPDGTMAVNTTGGPNLATGGTGDVLSGVIAGLLAQGMDPWEAAIVGVWLHGAAGDAVQNSFGDAGTLASDLLSHIPIERHILSTRRTITPAE